MDIADGATGGSASTPFDGGDTACSRPPVYMLLLALGYRSARWHCTTAPLFRWPTLYCYKRFWTRQNDNSVDGRSSDVRGILSCRSRLEPVRSCDCAEASFGKRRMDA